MWPTGCRLDGSINFAIAVRCRWGRLLPDCSALVREWAELGMRDGLRGGSAQRGPSLPERDRRDARVAMHGSLLDGV